MFVDTNTLNTLIDIAAFAATFGIVLFVVVWLARRSADRNWGRDMRDFQRVADKAEQGRRERIHPDQADYYLAIPPTAPTFGGSPAAGHILVQLAVEQHLTQLRQAQQRRQERSRTRSYCPCCAVRDGAIADGTAIPRLCEEHEATLKLHPITGGRYA